MPALNEKQERMWGMLCHLGVFAGYVIPFVGHIIVPLAIWLIKKEESEFVDDQGKESLNFQISMTIYLLVSWILFFIVIGVPLMIGLIIFNVVMIIMASVKSINGEKFRYPLSLRLIK